MELIKYKYPSLPAKVKQLDTLLNAKTLDKEDKELLASVLDGYIAL